MKKFTDFSPVFMEARFPPLNKKKKRGIVTFLSQFYNPKSEKVGTVWKTQIKKESSDF